MDFTFSTEQDALRGVARSFLEREAPSAYVRAMMDDDRGVTDGFWAKIVDLGWTERLGLLETVVLAEEMGKLPLPGPWLSAVCRG